jgi:hypothetical protein
MILQEIRKVILQNSWGKTQPSFLMLGPIEAIELKQELRNHKRYSEGDEEDSGDIFVYGIPVAFSTIAGIHPVFFSSKNAAAALGKNSQLPL